jgi:hypothetical protein
LPNSPPSETFPPSRPTAHSKPPSPTPTGPSCVADTPNP